MYRATVKKHTLNLDSEKVIGTFHEKCETSRNSNNVKHQHSHRRRHQHHQNQHKHHHDTISLNNVQLQQQQLPQLIQKTINRHFDEIIQNFHIEREDWTRFSVAKFLIKVVFWLFIYILFGYLTISASINIIQRYITNPIVVNMQAMLNQQVLLIPDSTVCLYFNVTKFFDAADIANRNGTNNASTSNILEEFFIEYNDSIIDGTLNLTPLKWPNTTNGVVVRYLIMMYETETLSNLAQYEFDFQRYEQMNDDYWAAVRNVLVRKIAQYNISIDQLKTTLQAGSIADDDCIFLFSSGSGSSCHTFNSISYIDHDSFCFRVISQDMQKESESYIINVFGTDGEGNDTRIWAVSVDFTDRRTPPPENLPANETDLVFSLSSNENYHLIYINITSLYISQPGVEKACSLDISQEECVLLCRSNQIKKLCGCAPVTFSKTYASDTFANCTMEKYETCWQYLGIEEHNCANKCIKNCEKWYYEYEMAREFYAQEYIYSKNIFSSYMSSHEYGTSRPLVVAWYFEKFFWIVIYTAGSISTAIYCRDLIQLYNSDPTQFNVAILFNKSITLPDARLCVDLRGGPIFYSPNAEDVGKEMVLTTELNTYFNQPNAIASRQAFLDPKRKWKESLVFVSYMYVSMLTFHELNLLNKNVEIYDNYAQFEYQTNNGSTDFFLKPDASEEEIIDIKYAFENILLPRLSEWNVSVDELRQKVGKEIQRMLNLQFTFYNGSLTVLQNARTEYIEQVQICYSLPVSKLLFTTVDDFFKISAKVSRDCSSAPVVACSLIEHLPSLSVDFSGSSFVVPRPSLLCSPNVFYAPLFDYGTHFYAQNGEMTNFSLAIDTFYSSLPIVNNTEKCEIKPAALWLCYYALIKRQCNCTPTANPLMSPPPSPGFHECNLTSYQACGIINYDVTHNPPECKNKDLPQCKTWSFSTTAKTVSKNFEELSEQGKTKNLSILFFVKGFTYATIEEQPAYTLQQFLAALGGMLGIWLGLSFFSLVRIVFFPIEFVLGLLLRSRNEKFATIFDPKKNWKVEKMTHSRLFLTIEYLFDFEFEKFRIEINLQRLFLYPIMTILFLPGFIETVSMCNNLIHRYSTGELSYSVMFNKNDTFTLPASTICLPINIANFKFIETQQKKFHEEPVQELIIFNDKNTLLNANWSISLLQLSLERLSLNAQIERIGSLEDFLEKPILVNKKNTTYGSLLNNWTTIQSFDDHLCSLNITAEELKQKWGKEFRKIITINFEHFNTTKGSRVSSEIVNETTFINETTICYKLQLDEITFASKKEGLSLFVNRELLPDFEKNSSLTINLNGRDGNLRQESKIDGSVITAQFGELSVFAMKIGAIFVASPYGSGAEKCSADETLEDCQDNCRISLIQKHCNCVPVSWSRLSAKADEFCSLDDYMNCFQFWNTSGQNYQNFQNELSECSAKCLPYCTIVKYGQNLQRSPIEDDHAEIIIKIAQFPYFAYRETFVYTFATFISEFGGDISLWVGLDFLLLMHISYFILCVLLRLIMVLIKKAPISDQGESIVKSSGNDSAGNRATRLVQQAETHQIRVISLE